MKTYILSLVMFLLLMSCEEENPQPVDYFTGSWSFTAPEIEIFFDVVYEGSGIYNYNDVRVIHPAISADQQTNCTMRTYDKFDGGFGRIEITSRGYEPYKVILIYNRFTEEGMAVYDLQIDTPSQPFIVLTDQTFTRAN